MNDEKRDQLLDQALARLAAMPGSAPSPGFTARVMELLQREEANQVRAFAQLLSANPSLREECAAIASKTALVAWLDRTARRHRLPAGPLLAYADRYFVSANDGELDDETLDAVVGAGTPGTGCVAGFLRTLMDPRR